MTRFSSFTAVALLAGLWGGTASAHENQAPPPQGTGNAASTTTTTSGAIPKERPTVVPETNRPLLYTSGGVLALAYVPSAIVGLASPKTEDLWLLAPVIGPWVALGEGAKSRNWLGDTALGVDGAVQGLAFVGIVAAMTLPPSSVPFGMNDKLRVTTAKLGRDGYGLMATGQF